MFHWKKRVVSLILAVGILISGISMQAQAAAVPEINTPVSQQAVLNLLDVYHPSSSNVLREMLNRGENFTKWWRGDSYIFEKLDTAVHEEVHAYSFYTAPFGTQNILIDGQYVIPVQTWDLWGNSYVFPSQRMIAEIPGNLRTFRFSTYVGSGSGTSANSDGAYGLLNEFAAYYAGMSMMNSLLPYFETHNAGIREMRNYFYSGSNNKNAYAEFKYWILRYMLYAQAHHPDVYQAILSNREFCLAYAEVESRYANCIAVYDAGKQRVCEYLGKRGIYASVNNGILLTGGNGNMSGSGCKEDDYVKLTAELQKPEYVNMHRQLVQAGGFVAQGNNVVSAKKGAGWLYANGFYAYIYPDGTVAVGWHNIDGSIYYFNEYGIMQTDTWIDGFYVNAEGAFDPGIIIY